MDVYAEILDRIDSIGTLKIQTFYMGILNKQQVVMTAAMKTANASANVSVHLSHCNKCKFFSWFVGCSTKSELLDTCLALQDKLDAAIKEVPSEIPSPPEIEDKIKTEIRTGFERKRLQKNEVTLSTAG